MPLIKGPFDLSWRGNTIADVEEIDVEVEQDEEDYSTVQHSTYTLDGPIKANITLTLLKSDVATLRLVFPQYHVANGGQLSTGETVNEQNGAIDWVALNCDDSTYYGNLDINACGTQSQVLRLVNARTRIDGIDIDDKVLKVMVKFLGEPDQGEGAIQFFEENSISVVS